MKRRKRSVNLVLHRTGRPCFIHSVHSVCLDVAPVTAGTLSVHEMTPSAELCPEANVIPYCCACYDFVGKLLIKVVRALQQTLKLSLQNIFYCIYYTVSVLIYCLSKSRAVVPIA